MDVHDNARTTRHSRMLMAFVAACRTYRETGSSGKIGLRNSRPRRGIFAA